jgi:hypothetical protein
MIGNGWRWPLDKSLCPPGDTSTGGGVSAAKQRWWTCTSEVMVILQRLAVLPFSNLQRPSPCAAIPLPSSPIATISRSATTLTEHQL